MTLFIILCAYIGFLLVVYLVSIVEVLYLMKAKGMKYFEALDQCFYGWGLHEDYETKARQVLGLLVPALALFPLAAGLVIILAFANLALATLYWLHGTVLSIVYVATFGVKGSTAYTKLSCPRYYYF